MAERIANIFLLVEDKEQQNLIRRYLELCGHHPRSFRQAPLPIAAGGGSGEHYVRTHFAEQVRAFRSCQGRRASALLLVMVDADKLSIEERAAQLAREIESADLEPRQADEPIAVLIPKRHVETWIRALLGDDVDENEIYKHPKPTAAHIKAAANHLFEWTRPNADPGQTAPPSLIAAIPEWRKASS